MIRTPPLSLVLLLLLLVDSLHFVFARALLPHLPPATSALFVLSVAAVELAIYLIATRRLDWHVLRDNLPFFLAIGFLVAASTRINYTAVRYIDAGTASLLAQIGTVYALGFSFFWLRERLAQSEWLGAVICIAGSVIITFQPGDLLRLGSLMVLGSVFMYSLHAAIVKRYGSDMDFANFFFFRVAGTSVFLLLFALGTGGVEVPTTGRVWLILIVAGTTDVAISRILYYWALRNMRIGIHAIVLTLSPVVTIGWSLALFREQPTRQAVIGGLVVLTGIFVVTMGRYRPKKVTSG